jgi:hypothetical protein
VLLALQVLLDLLELFLGLAGGHVPALLQHLEAEDLKSGEVSLACEWKSKLKVTDRLKSIGLLVFP